MHTRDQFYKAFVLHRRVYRDTSLLIEFFTEELGSISAVARGVRNAKNPLKGILQPFTPLFVSFAGKSHLLTLAKAETQRAPYLFPEQKSLFSALYLNEILTRVLMKQDPHPELYQTYEKTLSQLSDVKNMQKYLRIFEKKLLTELGYALPLTHDVSNEDTINVNLNYEFHFQRGFIAVNAKSSENENLFSGKTLIALSQEKLEDNFVLTESKRLLRLALMPLLGDKPLQTRRLLMGVTAHE